MFLDSRLSAVALLGLHQNNDLVEYLQERVERAQETLETIDTTAENPTVLIDAVRRLQLLRGLMTELSEYGEAAKAMLAESQ